MNILGNTYNHFVRHMSRNEPLDHGHVYIQFCVHDCSFFKAVIPNYTYFLVDPHSLTSWDLKKKMPILKVHQALLQKIKSEFLGVRPRISILKNLSRWHYCIPEKRTKNQHCSGDITGERIVEMLCPRHPNSKWPRARCQIF